MNNFNLAVDKLFEEYNLFLKQKNKNIKCDLNNMYKDFKENNNLTLENDKKKGKTAYQNYFSIIRKELQGKNLPFGEQSKLISNRWKALSASEKKKYNTHELNENLNQPTNIETYFISEQISDSESEESELHLVNEKDEDIYKTKLNDGDNGDEEDQNRFQEIESIMEEDDDDDENEIDEIDSVEFNFED